MGMLKCYVLLSIKWFLLWKIRPVERKMLNLPRQRSSHLAGRYRESSAKKSNTTTVYTLMRSIDQDTYARLELKMDGWAVVSAAVGSAPALSAVFIFSRVIFYLDCLIIDGWGQAIAEVVLCDRIDFSPNFWDDDKICRYYLIA